MSRDGVHRLLQRDAHFDPLLVAWQLLSKRLDSEATIDNYAKLVKTITLTHNVWFRKSYRPFVKCVEEYMKQHPDSSVTGLFRDEKTEISFTLPTSGHFSADAVVHVQFPSLTAPDANRFYRYCAYPGIRLFEDVKFESGGREIASYDSDRCAFDNKFFVSADRREAWDRCMGQQVFTKAEWYNTNGWTGQMQYSDGPQTPKTTQPVVDLWIPLRFSFCEDISQCLINNVNERSSQRKIKIRIPRLRDILFYVDSSGTTYSLPIERLAMRCELYSNQVFVEPAIYNAMLPNKQFNVFRQSRTQKISVNVASGRELLSQMKFAAEYLMVGFRDKQNENDPDRWHLMGRARTRTNATNLATASMVWNSAQGMCELQCVNAKEVATLDPIVTSCNLSNDAIQVFPEGTPISFYNAYTPQKNPKQFRGVTSPHDSSALLFPFCPYVGTTEPNGYLNASQARELYIKYEGTAISATQPAEIVVCAQVLNFIITSGDNIVPKFSL